MDCGCGRAIKKKCPDGYHIDVERRACVNNETGEIYTPSTTATEKPKVRMRGQATSYKRPVGNSHDVGAYAGRGEDLDNGKKIKIPEKQAQRIKQNRAKIRQYLQTLASRSKLRPLLVPLTAYYISYDFCAKKTAQYMQRAKNKQQKAMAEEYSKTMESILDDVPEFDYGNLDPDYAMKVLDTFDNKYRKLMEERKEQAKKKGKKSPEYAQYRAYADYIKMCEDIREKLEARIKGKAEAKSKIEQLQSQRSQFQ